MKRYPLTREYSQEVIGYVELADDAVYRVEDVIAPALIINYEYPKTPHGKAKAEVKIMSFSILQEKNYLRDMSERFKELGELKGENLNKG